jgi:formylglycine-generating enzyme required for sulfatase activity
MKHVFRIMIAIMFAILVFVVFKYFILKDKPHFTTTRTDVAERSDTDTQAVGNKPIPMVLVKGDSTIIGQLGPEAEDDEFPPRPITLRSFYISTTEIRREEWGMVFSSYRFDQDDKDLPVVRVSWFDALEFCNQKSLRDNLKPCYDFSGNSVVCDFEANGYRLPTEAEWEFAAKGGQRMDQDTYSGSRTADLAGWYSANSDGQLHPVGLKQENQLGIHDMSGNAFEWVWNWYGRYAYSQQILYEGPVSGTDKVIRGGSWTHGASEMRVTNRNYAKPHTQSDYIGFRVARSK